MSRWGGPIAIAEILLTSNNFQRYIAWKGGQVRRAVHHHVSRMLSCRTAKLGLVWVLQLSYRQGRTPQLQIGLLFQLREGPHRPVVRRAPLGSPGGALSALGLHPAVGAAAGDPGQPSGPAQRVVSSRRGCCLESQRAGTHPTRAQEPALAGGQTSKPALLARPDHRLAHLRVRPQMEPPSPYDRHRRRAQRRRRSLAGRPPTLSRPGPPAGYGVG